jgi:hypothetical protein
MTSNLPTVRPVDPTILERWFTVLADRYGRVIERVTVQQYLAAFDRAHLTDRSLDQACREVFESSRFLPEPEAFIIRARDAERRFRMEETVKLPRMDQDKQAAATADAEELARRTEAREWANQNIDRFRRIRAMVEREHCLMAGVSDVSHLSSLRAVMLRAALVQSCFAAKAGTPDPDPVHTCALPPHLAPTPARRTAADPASLTDVLTSVLSPLL